MSKIIWKIASKYRREGVAELFTSVPHFLLSEFVLLNKYDDNNTIDEYGLRELAAVDHNAWKYENGNEFTIEPEDTSTDLPRPWREKEQTYYTDPSFVYELEDCHLIGQRGLALTNNGAVVLNSTRNDQSKLVQYLRKARLSNKARLAMPDMSSHDTTINTAFPLIGRPSNYYAWLAEYLPKLRALEKYTNETGTKPTILIHENAPAFMIDSIEALGFDSYPIQRWTQNHARVERLILTNHRRQNIIGKYQPDKQGYQWLQQTALEHISEDESLPKRLYISRHDSDRRRAINEERVVNVLRNKGFKKLKLSEMSFIKQVQYLLNAEIAVGIQGAGFGNMIWSRDPTIIQIIPSHFWHGPTYYCLARILEFDHDFIYSPGNDQGVDVDIDSLSEVVDRNLQ